MPQNELLFKELNRWVQKKGDESVDFDELRKRGRLFCDVYDIELSEKDFTDTLTDVLENIQVVLHSGSDVVAKSFQPWFQAWQQEHPAPRWERYSRYLLEEKGWGPEVIRGFDQETSQLIDLAGDPRADGDWRRRGLAIGEVQSGKTANYIGVLNKALDAGYKLIIVIGGHTNDLRRQTQERVDSDLLGFDTAYLQSADAIGWAARSTANIGVGRIDNTIPIPHRLTSVTGDFNKSNKSTQGVTIGQEPAVAVIKKHAGTENNPGTLNNLAAFLRQQAPDGRLDIPMLVIDDESDWASVNTKDEENVAAVNDAIRNLLNSSRKSSYLAFTATPFANVLINSEEKDDLFPEDYIRALPSPSNYLGAEKYHSPRARADYPDRIQTDVEDMLQLLPFGHKGAHRIDDVPRSLRRSIYAFFLGTAVRRLRDGVAKPASMMVNVSSFNNVQESVFDQVDHFVKATANTLKAELGAGLPSESSRISAMREVLDEVYPDLQGDVEWEDLERPLREVANDIHSTLVNGTTTKEAEKYIASLSRDEQREHKNRPVVQVGGNVLSRGLTLEGLQVSYFVRRAAAADTLLQMGRWFGYRPKYEDLVRVWMDESVVELFDYAREISDELRASIGEMKRLNLTPENFGLRIRMHPETFRITAANKQRHAEVVREVSVHGSVFPSVNLSADDGQRSANERAARRLANRLSDEYAEHCDRGIDNAWRMIPAGVVREFFAGFAASAADPFLGPQRSGAPAQILDALGAAVNGDSWDVKFVSGSGKLPVVLGSGTSNLSVRPSVRNSMQLMDAGTIVLGNRRLSSANDLLNAIPRESRVRVEKTFKRQVSGPGYQGSKNNISESFVARVGLERPTLLVYFLIKEEGAEGDDDEQSSMRSDVFDRPLCAVSVAFPALKDGDSMSGAGDRGTRFIANTVYQQALRSYEEQGDDDLDEE